MESFCSFIGKWAMNHLKSVAFSAYFLFFLKKINKSLELSYKIIKFALTN